MPVLRLKVHLVMVDLRLEGAASLRLDAHTQKGRARGGNRDALGVVVRSHDNKFTYAVVKHVTERRHCISTYNLGKARRVNNKIAGPPY